MAKHKAPTEVTIVRHEEQSAFAAYVEKHWVKAALVAVVAAAFILFRQYQSTREAAQLDENWNKLMSSVEEDFQGGFTGDVTQLKVVSEELSGTLAGPWALYLRATNLRDEGDYSAAVDTLVELKSKHPKHPLVKDLYAYGDSLTPLSAVDYLAKVYEEEAQWRSKRPELFTNPEPPAEAPRVRIQTDQGDFVVALYSDKAPLHTANFLKLVTEGFYDGLAFHRFNNGTRIETGDPKTKDPESDKMSWGSEGAEPAVDAESSGLSHFEGFLSATPNPAGEGSSGSLISFTAYSTLALDGKNVVFGKVVEGLEVIREIALLPTDSTTQIPKDRTVITSMSIEPGA